MERLYPHLEAARIASGIANGRNDIIREYDGLSVANRFMLHDAARELLNGDFGPWASSIEAVWRTWQQS